MEYIPGGSLYSILHKSNVDLTFQQKLQISHDIASGLLYLHDLGIIHRDLKSTNVMVRGFCCFMICKINPECTEARLIDFGISKRASSTSRAPVLSTVTINLDNFMTPQYSAPEILLQQEATLKSDIYSFAIVL